MGHPLIYNYKIVIVVTIVFNIAYLTYDMSVFYPRNSNHLTDIDLNMNEDKEYIVDTPGCRIENLDAYSEEIKAYIYKVKRMMCTDKELLTHISRNGDVVTLNINTTLFSRYSLFTVSCCYSTIRRNPVEPNPDDNLIFSECTFFNDSVHITEDFVRVECSNFYHKVYENVHSTLQPPKTVASNKNDPNVILVGIDGVSRSNLIRSMPKTFEFCERNGWVNLKGYNKVADNTFPNLMAVLTGMNYSQAANVCDPYETKGLDNCEHFIWRNYKRHNYSTAYAEDTPTIATFNGIKVGFTSPPTDYYFRPYFLAADQLSAKYLCLKAHCLGPEKTGIRMQTVIHDFLSTVKGKTPGFGLFWMNSFSHEDVNCPSSMDEDFLEFFEDMQKNGYLDNTIVIFFSDHGFRFGKIRLTHTGWMEERLPFIYIWIPKKFRMNFHEEYRNLLENSEKLTTPYDLYMTLQDILSLTNKTLSLAPSQGCPECQSLFRAVNSDRSCSQAGIPQHYCTCSRYEKLNKETPLIQKVAEYFVHRINEIVDSYGSAAKGCSTYFLSKISHAKSLVIKDGVEENVLVGIITNPEAIFEGTVKVTHDIHDNSTKFKLMETNRLDRYAPKTFCVQNSPVEIYCYCRSLLKRVTNVFCNNKFCFLYRFYIFTHHPSPSYHLIAYSVDFFLSSPFLPFTCK